VFRISKETLKTLKQTAMSKFKSCTSAAFNRVVTDYLNLLLGTSTKSNEYWNDELIQSIEESFFIVKNPIIL